VVPSDPSGNDPSLAWGPRALYASYTSVDRHRDRPDEGLFLARSTDGGRAWRRSPVVEGYACGGPDRSTVAADPRRDVAYVTWVHYIETEDCDGAPDMTKTQTRWARTSDGGRTFTPAVTVTRDGLSNRIAGVVLPDGTFVTATTDTAGITPSTPACQFPTRVTVSRWGPRGERLGASTAMTTCDDAAGASPNGAVYTPISYPAIAADASTGALVVAMPSVEVSSGVRTARSLDGGRTWGSSSLVQGLPASTASMPAVSARGGRAALAWLEIDAAGAYRALLAGSSDDGGSWSAPLALSDAPSSTAGRSVPLDSYNIGHYMGVALGSDAVAHVVWPQLLSRPDAAADPDVFTRSASLR
jgi:hypothetical protein